MKSKLLIITALLALPISAFSQATPATPATPAAPAPPAPPAPPAGGRWDRDRDHDRTPRVPVTFLGVETSPVPSVVSEQLGLAKGFGLVVDYVVPDGPAAQAGVQQNDILKMLNDQILMEPDQLSKLIRSYSEGTAVTLSILRKGKEEKVTVKLGKKEVPQRRVGDKGFKFDWNSDDKHGLFDQEEFREQMAEMKENLRDQLKDLKVNAADFDSGMIRDVVENAHREAERVSRDAARIAEDAARQAADGLRVWSNQNGAVRSTKIDLGKAQIVYSDSQGEMKIETVDGKKILTAKDPQGKLLFSGPVDSKEEIDKIPAEVKQRYEKLEQKDLPTVVAPLPPRVNDDGDDDDDDDDDDDSDSSYETVCNKPAAEPMKRPLWGMNFVRL